MPSRRDERRGVLVHGHRLVGVWKDRLIARIGPDEGEAALREPHVRVFDQMTHAGLTKFFEVLLSVEDVAKYKPHADVYRWAAGRVGADVSECLLVAAHGWDVAGAAWAGMKTAFVARPGQQKFPLGPAIDITVPSLAELPGELERMAVMLRACEG